MPESCVKRASSGLLTHGEAADERVAGVLNGTAANGIVVSHVAQGALTARVLARVLASLVHASSALFTVSVHQTLGSAAGRGAEVSREAGAGCLFPEFTANAVGPAGRGLAGFHAF